MDMKIVQKKGQPPQAELRYSTRHSNILIIVGLDGYDYKYYTRKDKWSSTVGKNVHLALNGPAMLTFEELEQLVADVKIAREKLQSLT